jgi:hypothetical protein
LRGRAGHDGIEKSIHVVPLLFEVILDFHGGSVLAA